MCLSVQVGVLSKQLKNPAGFDMEASCVVKRSGTFKIRVFSVDISSRIFWSHTVSPGHFDRHNVLSTSFDKGGVSGSNFVDNRTATVDGQFITLSIHSCLEHDACEAARRAGSSIRQPILVHNY